jgi:hypothetical protein
MTMKPNFQMLHELEVLAYGQGNCRTAQSLDMLYRRWGEGFTVLWDKEIMPPRIMAVADVWCIEPCHFQALCNGEMREESLSAIFHVRTPSKQDALQCWYIASMIVAPEYRGRLVFNQLAKAVWKKIEQHAASSYTVMGVASSEAGWRILRRWSFKPWVETQSLQDGKIDFRPRYVKTVDNAKPLPTEAL